jgi:hypothetical protein
MIIINEEKLEMKQAPETRKEGVGQCSKQCRHESQEDWKEQIFIGNALEINTLQSDDNETENQITDHQDHENTSLEEIIRPISNVGETTNRNLPEVYLTRRKSTMQKTQRTLTNYARERQVQVGRGNRDGDIINT